MGDDLDAEFAAFEAEVKSLGPVTKATLQELQGDDRPSDSSSSTKPPTASTQKSKALHTTTSQHEEPSSKRAKLSPSTAPKEIAGAEPTLNREYLHSIVNSYRHEEDTTGTSASFSSGVAVTTGASSAFLDYNHPGLPTTLSASQNQDYQNQQSAYNYDPNKIREREENKAQGKSGEESAESGKAKTGEGRKFIREVGDKVWEDKSLAQWPENDFRIFVGNLGKEITSESLGKPFKEYASYNMSRVVQNKASRQSRGYGFVSFGDPHDMLRALREKQGKYLGHRPMYIKRSKWQERDIRNARARKKQEKRNKRAF